MALEEYAKKRSFDQTPEPKGQVGKAPHAAPRYCVQRHHASHLHYDLRLEMDGVFKSWAVPKGPTLDPSVKHLAMMVEDHPLDYGNFEGVIPAGNYGAGSVMLWDRGTFELLGDKTAEEQLARGDFKFRVTAEKINGEFALVHIKRGKGNEWLLLKKKDPFAQTGWDPNEHAFSVATGRTQEEIARNLEAVPQKQGKSKPSKYKMPEGAVKSPMPAEIEPMLAQSTISPPAGDAWLFEIKWDGVRSLCFINSEGMRLTSRRQNAMEQQYPELTILPHHVNAESAILDGEIVTLDDKGVPSFALLQRRITVGDAATIARLSRSKPVVLYIFDLLYLDGYDLRDVPLIERKKLLAEVLIPGELVKLSDHFPGKGAELLALAKEKGLEGILAKRADSRYEGKRTDCWFKIKIVSQQEFVICGFAEGERDHFGSLILGLYEGQKLVYTGNVGTGFDQAMIREIYKLMEPLITDRVQFKPVPKMLRPATWIEPELVCEVRFSNWTEEGRLRAPVFLGLRTDLDAKDCVRETSEPPPEIGKSKAKKRPAKQAARTHLLAPDTKEETLEIDGHRLKFTNLNKVFYPDEGYTKRDLLNYYDAVAELILPHLCDRPLSLKRYPNGIEGKWFFQKDASESFPDWLRTVPIKHDEAKEAINYVVADDRASLLYLVNLGCIDQNPGMSRVESLDNPDFILIDLDPHECPYDKIVEAALLVRKKLAALGLEGYPKTTGGDGMHIYIPIEPHYTFEQARYFTEIVARVLAAERPDLFTTPRSVAKREKGRVYFDWLQIGSGKTISAPYVLRAYPKAPVATPLAWSEVKPGLIPQQWNISNAVERFERIGDLFSPVLNDKRRLEPALEKLVSVIGGKEV